MIETGVPIQPKAQPKRVMKRRDPLWISRYPELKTIQVGESFFVPDTDTDDCVLRSSIVQYRRITNNKIVTRRVLDDNFALLGTRVWRIG